MHVICERFEQSLQNHESNNIEQYLTAVTDELQEVLFAELLAIELQRKVSGDRSSLIAHYKARFPERTAEIARVFQDELPLEPTESHAPRRRVRCQESGNSLCDQPADRIGRYKLLERLGEGGMGIVYRAEQKRPFRRQVALKIVKPGRNTLRFTSLLKTEGQILARMNHAGIVQVFDTGTTPNGRLYLVMELVLGPRITEYCDQHCLSIDKRLDLYLQVCLAVQHAHQMGVIHCDLKPSNILIADQDGVPIPKVIDFGLAKVFEQELDRRARLTDSQSLAGTPAYMSPEQTDLNHDAIGPRSDIYALGILLYELLAGKPPFDGSSLLKSGFEAMLRAIREVEPSPPSQALSQIGEEELAILAQKRATQPTRLLELVRRKLDRVVMKCLKKDPGQRYKTSGELAKVIRRHRLSMLSVAIR